MKNIYFINAHPDDLNAGLGLALILKEFPGHYQIHVLDFTRGERGLEEQHVSLDECAAIRIKEETAVCAELGVKPEFLDQIDGDTYVTKESCARMADLFRKARPDVVITHFPVDTHIDHLMCTAAVMRTLQMTQFQPEIYYYRQSMQSRCMNIDHYVAFDERIMERKCELLALYVCQDGTGIARRQRIEEHGE